MTTRAAIADSITHFAGDPRQAGPLLRDLGFEPIADPVDLLGRGAAGYRPFFEARDDRFGVRELYRVGALDAPPGTVAAYVAVLEEWGIRSSDRDRARRRVARSLVELASDSRALFFLVPNELERASVPEVELVFPRPAQRANGGGAGGAITTVRALIDVREPNRFHRELLEQLAIPPGSSLAAISQQWQRAFSVERVTKAFYQEYQDVREAIAEALLAANPDHEVVRGLSQDDGRAWATRQLGRVLFLWFLQSKRWLGGTGQGEGRADYLLDLWRRRTGADGGYYDGMLVPLFFEGMAKRNPGQRIRELLEYTPYLNGGLFRTNALEDRINAGGDVTLPDEVFDPDRELSVLGLLSRYRFTTRESTPDDQSVDPDPELLGRVFENLYQGDERHDTGTYYTPREIVHFMCRQALDGYLRDTAEVDQETIEWLRREVVDPEATDRRLDREVERRIINALENVRVCDPAVGSGAFLLGTMQEIVQIRRGIAHAKEDFTELADERVAGWKRHAIQWSLYGVDINPEAVEICQLRLWLSLVLDMQSPRETDPLPNLDFRIVAGDSLIDRAAGIPFVESLPQGQYQLPMGLSGQVGREERSIEQWRREFEATQDNPDRLRELRDNIARARQRIIRYHLETHLEQAREALREAEAAAAGRGSGSPAAQRRRARGLAQARARVEQLDGLIEGLRPNAPYQKPFLWPVAFPEVFQHGGFDIVLANPPYVRMERIDNADERVYGECFPQVAASRADILVYFYARAVQILRDGGWLSFITSNKYMRAAYGAGTRSHLPASLCVERVIDFGDLPLFDSNGRAIAAYPAVLVGCKGSATDDHRLRVADLTHPVRQALADAGRPPNPENVRELLQDLDALLAVVEVPEYPQRLLRSEGWILDDPPLVRLFDRLMSQGTPLAELTGGQIYMGVKTGLNEAFVIDEATREEILADDPRSGEIIKKWLRGQDIQRWRPRWSGLYIIFTSRGVQIERYPAVTAYLERFRERLERRATAHVHPWYELQQPQEGVYGAFERPKIIWPQMGSPLAMEFSYDSEGYYVNQKTFVITDAEPWLVPILNSRLFLWLADKLSGHLRGGWLELNKGVIGQMPIVAVTAEEQANLEQITREATENLTDVDLLVESLYGLSEEEQRFLSRWFERQRGAFGASGEGRVDDD